MEIKIEKSTLKKIFIVIAACILLTWLLNETERVSSVISVISGVASPFLIGSVIAFILNVPMRFFERLLHKIKNATWRRVTALSLTILAILAILAAVSWLLINQVSKTVESLVEQLPQFYNDIQTTATNFFNEHPKLMEWVYQLFPNLDIAGLFEKLMGVLGNGVSSVLTSVFSVLKSLAGSIINIVIGIVFAVYCLFQKEALARQCRRLMYAFIPEKVSDHVVRIMRMTNSTFSNFLSGQCLEVCILGVMFAISMAIFQMPYIPLVSVLVAVTAFIPVVGAFAGCIVGALLIFVDSPMQAVWFVVLFLVLQQIENNLIYPRVVGTSIGLPGMWVLVAVAVGGEIMGVTGMFMMIPLAAVLYTLMREVVQKRIAKREIDSDKLRDQPPEIRSKVKEIKERKKQKNGNTTVESTEKDTTNGE